MRYEPPNGTAGLLRERVNGMRRSPFPPARIRARTRGCVRRSSRSMCILIAREPSTGRLAMTGRTFRRAAQTTSMTELDVPNSLSIRLGLSASSSHRVPSITNLY